MCVIKQCQYNSRHNNPNFKKAIETCFYVNIYPNNSIFVNFLELLLKMEHKKPYLKFKFELQNFIASSNRFSFLQLPN